MILDLKPTLHDHAPCTETVYINVCRYLQRDYELMFAGAWGFAYFSEKEIGEEGSIEYYEEDYWMSPNVKYLLEKYNGIAIEAFYPKNTKEAYEKITSQISSGLPVGIYIDTYFCPWSIGHKIEHIAHYCLTIGIDNDLKKLHCLDTYFSQLNYEMPFESYDQGYEKLILFSKTQEKKPDYDWEEIVDFIRKDIKNKVEIDIFSDMTKLANYISELDNMDDFFGKYYDSYTKFRNNVNLIPIFRMINYVFSSRINFATALKFIYSHYNKYDLLDIAEKLVSAANLWSVINSLFMRALVMKGKHMFNKKIAEKIHEVASIERELAIYLLQQLN